MARLGGHAAGGALMNVQQTDGGGGLVPGAAWWPMREWPHSRPLHGGTWLVTVGNYWQDSDKQHTQRFVFNFGAVIDDFGNLVKTS